MHRAEKILTFSFILLIATQTYALTIDEKPLTDFGFTGLSATALGPGACQTIEYIPLAGTKENGNDTVLTLDATFDPQADPDANITIELQGSAFTSVISPSSLYDGKTVHVRLPDEYAVCQDSGNPENISCIVNIRICANPSLNTKTISVRAGEETRIGLYRQARFDEEGAFYTTILETNPELGKEAQVQVVLTNNGALTAEVEIDYRKYDLEYIPLLKGETGFAGEIGPGETKTLTYTIKPLRPVQILLPPAVLTYTNVFGEEVKQESTRAYLDVEAPEFNVKGAFLVTQNQVRVDEPITITWVVQNEGLETIMGIDASFFVRDAKDVTATITSGATITPNDTTIAQLNPGISDERVLTYTFSRPGTYYLDCDMRSPYDPTVTAGCQDAQIDVIEDNPFWIWLLSFTLLLVSVGVYVFITMNQPPRVEKPAPRKEGARWKR